MKKIVVLVVLALAAIGPAAAADYFWLQSFWKADAYLNIQQRFVAATDVEDGWHSGQWSVEDVAGGYVRLRNRWTGCYLHIERGKVECTTDVKAGWQSAQWSTSTAQGNAFFLRNRWKGCFLNIEKGPVVCSAIQPGWQSAMWLVEE
jgi:hypothetical protein